MHFTIFHILAFIFLLLFCVLVCVLIFLKIKQKEMALIFYTITIVFTSIIIYSIFLTINQFTTQAKLSKLSYTRELNNESLIIKGRVDNLTHFNIRKCYLYLNINNKKQVGQEIFDNKNLRNAKMRNTSISYTIEIVDSLPGNTYKDFTAVTPFPPNFDNPEFYHTLTCI